MINCLKLSITYIALAAMLSLTQAKAQRLGDVDLPERNLSVTEEEITLPRVRYGEKFDLPRMSEEEIDRLLAGFIADNGDVDSAAALKEHNKIIATPAHRVEVLEVTKNGKASVVTLNEAGQATNDPVSIIENTGIGNRAATLDLSQIVDQGGSVRIAYVIDRSGSMAGKPLEAVKQAFLQSLKLLPNSPSILCKAIWFNHGSQVMNEDHDNGWVTCDAANFDLDKVKAKGGTKPAPILLAVLEELAQPVSSGTNLSGVIVLTDGDNLSPEQAGEISAYSTPIMTHFSGETPDKSVYPDISRAYSDHSQTTSPSKAFDTFLKRFVFARVIDLNISGQASE